MSILKVYLGDRGTAGANAFNGSGVADIRGSVVDNPLLSGLYNNKLSRVGAITATRTGEAVYTDRYGDIAYSSTADVTNLTPYSNDFSQWDDPLNKWTILTTNNTDPVGGSTATEIQLDEDISENETAFMEEVYSAVPNGTKYHTCSFWIKIISGTVTSLNVHSGVNYNHIKANLDSTWQRVTTSFAPNGSSFILSLNVVGLSGAKFQIYGFQLEEGSVVHDYIPTTGTAVTVSGTGTAIRQNELGNIISGENTNLIINNENLNESNWSTVSGTITEYTGLTPLNGYRENIEFLFDTTQSMQLETTGTYTEGTTYTISAYVYVASGAVSALLASVAGGAKISFGVLPTSGFVRMSVECVAGSGSGIKFEATSLALDGQLLFFGVQAETGSIGTYIRNGSTTNTNPADVYAATVNTQASSNWSVGFTLKSIPTSSAIKYIFYADSNFNCYIQDTDLKVKNGSTTKTISLMLDADNIAITFDGTSLRTYKNGNVEDTQTVSGASSTINSTLYLGADNVGTNVLDGQLSMFDYYDELLTDEEIKYLVEKL